MIKIVQFGEGNFLRTFADFYFDNLNKNGGDYKVAIVKPIPFGDLDKFRKQGNVYHVVLRGARDGRTVEEVYEISCVQDAIDPFSEYDRYLSLARDRYIKMIVSNTTEAGICFCEGDRFDGFYDITYPAKLTKFLFERFKNRLDGVYVLPVELIDDNADELYRCVKKYIKLWDMPLDFERWIDNKNTFCNTLVDRIVSGYPRDEETKTRLTRLIGKEDALMSVGEPFGLWVIEDKGGISDVVKPGFHGIEVVLTNNIKYYKKRKVRVLNGSHTNLVYAGLWHGKETVYDCMTDEALLTFAKKTLKNEIIPFVSDDVKETESFADSVIERFFNPYLCHRLTSIALNGISKWRARDLPSFSDYYRFYGRIPKNLTVGFSYLLATYASLKKADGRYLASLPSGKIEIADDIAYLEYFSSGGDVFGFMKDKNIWGEDLTQYSGFAEEVENNVGKILGGEYWLS